MGLTCPVFSLTGGPGTIAITITPVSGETVADYTIQVYSDSGGTTQIASDVITGTTKTFTGLTAGTYYVRVTPSDNVHTDPVCGLQSVVVSAASFDPITLGNLWGWYKGDAGITDNGSGAATVWADQSGNSRDMYFDGTRPAIVTNALNGITVLDGSPAQMATGQTIGPVTNITVYVVGKIKTGDADPSYFVSAGENIMIARIGSAISGGARTGNVYSTPQVAASLNTWYTILMRSNNTGDNISLNGGTETSQSRTPNTIAAAVVKLFDASGSGSKKQIAEVLIFTEDHDSTKRTNVLNYLKNKYNHY